MNCQVKPIRKKSLVLFIGFQSPFIEFAFKEQLDLEKKPLFCFFLRKETSTIRVFEF